MAGPAPLPILWSTGADPGPIKRIAIPMIGGILTFAIYTLVLIPVFYMLSNR